jgi:hypothetical protein
MDTFNKYLPRTQVRVNIMLQLMVSQPVYLAVKPDLEPKTRFLVLSHSCGFVDMGRPFWWDEGVCCLQLLLVLTSAVILRSESHGTYDHMLLSQIRDSSNLKSQVPVLYPRKMVAQLYPQTLGYFFIASYDSQGCGGGIRTCLHMGAAANRVRDTLQQQFTTNQLILVPSPLRTRPEIIF